MLITNGFDPDGSLGQLASPSSVNGVENSIVARIAERCLRGSFKRRGTIVLSREQLGLPLIEKIEL